MSPENRTTSRLVVGSLALMFAAVAAYGLWLVGLILMLLVGEWG